MDAIDLQEALWPDLQRLIDRAVAMGCSRTEAVRALLDLSVAEVCAGELCADEAQEQIAAALKRIHGS